jgi:hypothetical protein
MVQGKSMVSPASGAVSALKAGAPFAWLVVLEPGSCTTCLAEQHSCRDQGATQ